MGREDPVSAPGGHVYTVVERLAIYDPLTEAGRSERT